MRCITFLEISVDRGERAESPGKRARFESRSSEKSDKNSDSVEDSVSNVYQNITNGGRVCPCMFISFQLAFHRLAFRGPAAKSKNHKQMG